MEELINEWKMLNDEATKLLNKHQSFRSYNNVRLQMDKIEEELFKKYNVDTDKLYNN